MADDVVFVGGGGHASVLLDALGGLAGLQPVGYVAPMPGRLSELGVAYLGTDEERFRLFERGIRLAILGVAGAHGNDARQPVFEAWRAAGFEFVDVVHERATVAASVVRGRGLQCLAGAVINAGTTLGANVIVNSNATVEHDCVVGDHAHVAPGATLCAGVVVGAGAFIGAGAVIVPGVPVGAWAMVGAGSVVIRAVIEGGRVAGVPAGPLRSRQGGIQA